MAEQFTASMLIEYGLKRRGLCVADLGVTPIVVLTWQDGILHALVESTGAQRVEHWPYGELYPLYHAELGGRCISCASMPIGAPATIAIMEEMIACGARLFVGVGTAGSLQPTAPVGTFILPTSCIREEGTSRHYLPPRAALAPSPRLAAELVKACEAGGDKVLSGPLWTTDAPYRELTAKVRRYSRRGVLGVDMETSAMYALGQFRGLEVCNLLVISDELWPTWRPAFGSPELRAAEERAARAVLRCV